MGDRLKKGNAHPCKINKSHSIKRQCLASSMPWKQIAWSWASRAVYPTKGTHKATEYDTEMIANSKIWPCLRVIYNRPSPTNVCVSIYALYYEVINFLSRRVLISVVRLDMTTEIKTPHLTIIIYIYFYIIKPSQKVVWYQRFY